jgi:LysM repeat protein
MRPSPSSLVLTLALALASLTAQAGEPQPEAEPQPAAEPQPDADGTVEPADESEGDPNEVPVKPRKSAKKRDKQRNDEACDFQSPIHWHVVQAGEHLGLIAGLYGVMSEDLVALNPKLAENPNFIRVGEKLAVCPEIPPREIVDFEYVVKPGDTFNKIAHDNGLAPEELLELQDGELRDPNRLRVGHKLRIVTVGEILPGFEPEPPQAGRLSNGRRLPDHHAYTIKRKHNVYGTSRTIRLLGQVADDYARRADGGPKLRIGDISKDGGGPLAGHLSHQEGKDVDIGLVLTGELADRLHFSGASAKNIDLHRTWILIEELIATGEVRVIYLDYEVQALLYEHARKNGVSKAKLDEYFQYPRGTGRTRGLIRHWRGHENHLHVRFR